MKIDLNATFPFRSSIFIQETDRSNYVDIFSNKSHLEISIQFEVLRIQSFIGVINFDTWLYSVQEMEGVGFRWWFVV